jgi:hypothetical protein
MAYGDPHTVCITCCGHNLLGTNGTQIMLNIRVASTKRLMIELTFEAQLVTSDITEQGA